VRGQAGAPGQDRRARALTRPCAGRWERMGFDQKEDLSFDLRWTEVRSDIDFARFRDRDQLANHIPNASVVTTKHGLVKSLRDLDRRRRRAARAAKAVVSGGAPGGPPGLASFLPETFLLSLGSDKAALHAALHAGGAEDAAARATWIVKPTSANQARPPSSPVPAGRVSSLPPY